MNPSLQRGQHQPEDARRKRGDGRHVAGVAVEPDKRQQGRQRQRREQRAPQRAALAQLRDGHHDDGREQHLERVLQHGRDLRRFDGIASWNGAGMHAAAPLKPAAPART